MVRAKDIPTLEQVLTKLRENLPALRAKYQIKSLAVFGSYVRGEQEERSDLDILVDFEEDAPLTLIGFVGLQNSLSDLLGVKVDLVERKGLKPRMGDRVVREALAV